MDFFANFFIARLFSSFLFEYFLVIIVSSCKCGNICRCFDPIILFNFINDFLIFIALIFYGNLVLIIAILICLLSLIEVFIIADNLNFS